MYRKEQEKARRRLFREQGTAGKDWGGKLPIAIVYPSSYYIGMSNLGIHALYRLFNRQHNIVAERVFWEKENILRPVPPLALESGRPLLDFAVIAFSVTYELDYFYIPQILRASGIPLYTHGRNETHPLIIAGGPCITANPLPLAPFFDCLCIGEAEPILPALLPALTQGVSSGRSELLELLAGLPGIYVPARNSGRPIVRQWARKLDDFPVHSEIVTPDTELGGLYLIEVARGCPWRCRFCLVSNCFHPFRWHSLDSLLGQAREGLRYRRRMGLMGAAVTDHPQIEELLDGVLRMEAGISISSLRINSLSSKIMSALAQGGAESVTIAPEAGSEGLRRVINKGVHEDDVLKAAALAAEHGIKHLKLYFMLGLPNETDGDIEEIIRLTLQCKEILDRRQKGGRITVNVAPFVPKAGTPFQRLPMAEIPVLNRYLSRLRESLSPEGIKIKSESPAWSEVQAVLARGDAALAPVLADIKQVSISGWKEAIEKNHLDATYYAHRECDTSEKLPWSFISLGD